VRGRKVTVGRQSRRGGAGGQVRKVLTTASGLKTAVHYSPDGLIDVGVPNTSDISGTLATVLPVPDYAQ